MHSIVVVNKPMYWNVQIPEVEVVSAKDYLTSSIYSEISNIRVYNLCQSFRYQSLGYYVSLLAEARGHRSFPNITTIQDLKSQSIIRIISDELNNLIQQSLKRIKSDKFNLHIYFGNSVVKRYEKLSKHLFNLFPAPLLDVHFIWNKDQKIWALQNIFPLPLNQVPQSYKPYLFDHAREYFSRKRYYKNMRSSKLIYDIAILINPNEKKPPSDKKAIKLFLKAAEKVGMRAKIISKNDYSRLPEFDALFIRETTAVNHHTYRFARRASAENIVVIDDPISIVKCANKVYMAEVMKKAHIPTPKTIIAHKKNTEEILDKLGLPCVLKQPDGSFSYGVVKARDPLELDEDLHRFLNQSDLIIAQEYLPTAFDWRIGVLDNKPFYACRYYMAKDHWQIAKWSAGACREGNVEAVAIEEVPKKILTLATRAANLIGNGFYGVDLKQTKKGLLVIEINDNPSIEAHVEDGVLKEKLYLHIMQYFVDRIKKRKEIG